MVIFSGENRPLVFSFQPLLLRSFSQTTTMFSANENLALRQHKRRIIEYVEECIPEDVLDLGVTCMVMQVSCKAPGCVPLETVIMILFPKSDKELLPGIKESKNGGTYKTKVLMPMAEITKQDVVEALPPPMGTRSVEKLCFQARDVMLAQITQLMGEDDLEGREMMADYLASCLNEYKKRGCVAPEYGAPFPTIEEEKKQEDIVVEENIQEAKEKKATIPGAGNFVFRHDAEENGGMNIITAVSNGETAKANGDNANKSAPTETLKATSSTNIKSTMSSTMDWRRQQNIERQVTASSQSIISRLSEREHAPGVRMAGCPCCDPDNVSNYVDSMMML